MSDSAARVTGQSAPSSPRAAELVRTLELAPHPEGGYYREIWRADHHVAPADGRGPRAALTSIWFLLPEGAVSRWHRVRSDEVWHHVEGAPLELLTLSADTARIERNRLGPLGEGRSPVYTVPALRWQAARPLGAYTLASCTVGPGFTFDDFELLADRPELADALCAALPEAHRFR
jgi:predicted cupin superfamily sugar epimerase